MKKLVCEYCGSPNVTTAATVDPNTNEIVEYWGEKQDNFCHNCYANDMWLDEKEFPNESNNQSNTETLIKKYTEEMTDWETDHILVDKIGMNSKEYYEIYNKWFNYFQNVVQEILSGNYENQ